MERKIETIKIEIFKEVSKKFNGFSAIVIWDGKMQYATQGKNYPELYANIYDLMKIKLENDSEDKK